ncbi:MAG: 30S ribosomal protein S2 [Patescibacteria group bacterium]
MKIPSLEDLMKSGVHFGHQKSKWHPKMAPFLFTEKNGIHIINLEQTQKQLEKALDFARQTVLNGGNILFLGTKKQAKEIVRQGAIACNMPFVVNRWLGGTLTNATSVFNTIKRLRKIKDEKATGAWEKYTKKERVLIDKEIIKLEALVGGMEKINKIPTVIFVVDIKTEKTAIAEANRCHVPLIAVCDSNVNPEMIDYPIPGNDDAISSIKLLVNLLSETILEAQKELAEKLADSLKK